jgi:hypothetical protein
MHELCVWAKLRNDLYGSLWICYHLLRGWVYAKIDYFH